MKRPLRRTLPVLLPLALPLGALAGCEGPPPVLEALPPVGPYGGAVPRVSGSVGSPTAIPPAQFAYGAASPTASRSTAPAQGNGEFNLDLADTDIREVVAQILGSMLRVNYAIDPGVHGNVTLHTVAPLPRAQLLPTLQALLSQVGATLVQSGAPGGGGLYRVVPAAAALAASGGDATSGSVVVPLHYASAEDLAKVLQPFVTNGGKLVPDPGRNALLVGGDAGTRDALVSLVRSFDIDMLAGQSYALMPIADGDAKDFATALQDAFHGQSGGALAGVVRVVPMERVNSVLIVSSQPRYIEEARRVFTLVDRARRQTTRSWRVTYLQNSHANDTAYVLQQAFTPNDVTAQPESSAVAQNSGGSSRLGAGANGMSSLSGGGTSGGVGGSIGGAGGSMGGGSIGGGIGGSIGGGGYGGASGGIGGTQAGGSGLAGGGTQKTVGASANPLLGGLDSSAQNGGDANSMRIIPNEQNNALLIYGTPQEQDTVEAMLRKIDILPLQVRIDATIAEVTLNDELQYGTQFFFKSGGINGILSNAVQSFTTTNLASAAFGTTLPGFIIGGHGLSGAPLAISALQQVTTVHVLSSPELMVLDNQTARLQVGNLVPYTTGTTQSTVTGDAPIVSSVSYQQTGVITQVTPRVNSGGLVTMDISQEVSGVDPTAPTTAGIASPTFQERSVQSRVVVQDGQTVGLAGLILDNVSRGNSGIPWLKDIPVLGLLAGSQNNQHTRTELLILITPHVMHDARDARALTEDMRTEMLNAAMVPEEARRSPPSGSPDPGRAVRRGLGLEH